jgi:hypothetical protein
MSPTSVSRAKHPRECTMQNMKELGEKIAKIMEEYKMRVYDFEFIEELIEKTIERDQKECSY